MANRKRDKYLVDYHVQGALVAKAVLYWLFYLVTVTTILLLWRIVYDGPARLFYTHFADMWEQYGPALVVSVLMLPVVIIDAIRLSNRFAGPVYRLRRSMRELAEGREVKPLKFREHDFWTELAGHFNAIATRLNQIPSEPISRPEEELVGAAAEHSA